MNLEHYMIIIAQGLAEVLQRGKVCHLEQGFMTEAERGWSGAEVRRLEVTYENGNKESLIFKKATLKERMAIENVGSVKSPPSGTDWSPRVAEAFLGLLN
ncbi:hypothetical protein MHH52_10910 [Paenibacillus sp. FSL K6-0276]|uniref:hypothetical protein n=1 Tax=Paenibacillus sp. FSL K6-0276 TaxID=2921450 RepID=UPI0030EFA0F2